MGDVFKKLKNVDCIRHSRRTSTGSQIAEFAPALVILVGFVVVPLLDLTIVPVRWMLAQQVVNEYARRLAICETFSQSIDKLKMEPTLKARLAQIGGVDVKTIELNLKVTRVFPNRKVGDVLLVKLPRRVPSDWLPDGAKAPCAYSIQLEVNSLLSPAIVFPRVGVSVPGLTDPIPLSITASHAWENFGRDPATGQYFLNE